MSSDEIRKRFLGFFEERGHVAVPSSSLVPDDPSVLLTTAGMQQFKKYYTGELDAKKDFQLTDGKPALGTVSVQKSFRTSDIDEVGDERHLTFFEMLGNFSFGGYFKKEAIAWAHEFITKEMGLPISYVTVFKGEYGVPKDEESKIIWRSLGVTDIREEGAEDVFWGPTGASGPCGPTTEIYCQNGAGQDIEVWNIVFNEFLCTGSREELLQGKAELRPLASKGIDTGMGFERLVMCAQKTPTIFETDLFVPIIKTLPEMMGLREKRVIADHIRASMFLLADGVWPSNKGAGYVLRRLIRRATTLLYLVAPEYGKYIAEACGAVYKGYHDFYLELESRAKNELGDVPYGALLLAFDEEQLKFRRTLEAGLRELRKIERITAPAAFRLFESYGLPYEVIKEVGGVNAEGLQRVDFDREFEKHQEVSRAGQEKKFGGHGLLLDTGELKAGNEEELKKVTRLHTATHLLHEALRRVLGPEVSQRGSDITTERTRFDFSFPRKLNSDEVKRVEETVNVAIKAALPVRYEEMSKEEAGRTGALHFFGEKYPEKVRVYYVGDTLAAAYSKEFCGGPHVENTSEISTFRIVKEEAVGAGVRRIRGIVEP